MGKWLGEIMKDSKYQKKCSPLESMKGFKQGKERQHCTLEGYPCGGWRIEKGVGRPVWRLRLKTRSKVMRLKPG